MPKSTEPANQPSTSTIPNVVYSRKKRYTRVRTGCKDCRTRRVRCPEGRVLPDGRRESCRHCQRGNVHCFYPQYSSSNLLPTWIPAADNSQIPQEADSSTNTLSQQPTTTTINEFFEDFVPSSSIIDEDCYDQNGEESRSRNVHSQSPQATSSQFTPSDTNSNPQISDSTPQLQLWERRLLRNFLSPTISMSPKEEGLASASGGNELDRIVIQSFESVGCKDVVAARSQKSNWIFSVLFPRLLDLLTYSSLDDLWQNSRLSLKKYASHAFLQMCYAHHANTQSDVRTTNEMMMRANKHRSSARSVALQLRVRYPKSFWQVEEYPMCYFMTCMADFLSVQTFQIDETAYLALKSGSEFSKSLIHLIEVYKNFSSICSPPDINTDYEVTAQEVFNQETLVDKQDFWVENFFGISLSMIEIFSLMNKIVCYRVQVLRSAEESDLQGKESSQEKIQQLLEIIENGEILSGSLWNMKMEGKARRVQRGTLVALYALKTMVYSELYEADLWSDHRLQDLRSAAIELVSDSNIDEMAGYHLTLAIIAIYIPEREQRRRFLETINVAQRYSFGENYKGTFHVIQECWDEYDLAGKYRNGIAPWREFMAATGISLCI